MSALKSQTIGPKSFERHLVSRAQGKKRAKRFSLAGLMLTPMVDMFSLLVIFLLQSFSTSPEMPLVNGINLPSASTGGETIDAPVLSISDKGIFLDAKLIGSVEQVLADPTDLAKKLADLRDVWMKTHPGETEFAGEINLQAHKDIPSPVISEVLGMVSNQAYGSFRLAVVGQTPGSSSGGAR